MLYPKPHSGEEIPEFRFSPNPNRAGEINWNKWSEEAFQRAEEEKKPILLGIGAVWCHWCHVMDETSYSNEKVIKIINERYIPIRVEADRRPDIQRRYLLSGWPTTSILTATGEVITSGTYIPPGQFSRLLQKASDYYQNNREEIENDARQRRNQIVENQFKRIPTYHELSREIPNEVVKSLHRSFDSEHGGFFKAPKFPNPAGIELLLRRAFLEDESRLLEMANISLDHMSAGGINDKIWGGFFRYATERDWSKPHYEKILADNAMLIINYLRGYQISNFERYREVAEKTLRYVDEFLANKELGGFSGSQDADEKFYQLNAKDRLKSRLPYIDPIIYTDANSLMVTAYIEAFKILGDDAYLSFARRTIDFLISNCYSPDVGMAHYYNVSPRIFGLLSDQVNMIGALIDLFNVTGENTYLGSAKQLVEICEKSFRTEDGGAFLDRALNSGEPELGALFIKSWPIPENCSIARHLYRLAYIDGDDRYEKLANLVLANIEPDVSEPTPEASLYGLAIDEVLTQPVVLTVIGNKSEKGTQSLLREAWRQYIPGKEVRPLDPVRDYSVVEKLGFPAERHPAMYPCIGRMCLPAVNTPHEFRGILEDLAGRPR